MTEITYEARGVSADKKDVEAAIAGLDAGLFPGAFCHLVPDLLGGDPDWCLAHHADGVGSKSAIAYLTFRETGDPSAFASLAQDSLVMNTDDLLCAGMTGPFLVSNTIGRNANLIPGEAIAAVIGGYHRFAERLRPEGLELALCGGETADIGDLVRTMVIDSTVAGRMRRDQVIDASRAQPGHVIIGLASYGQATYEDAPNSGIGTNGLTAARHEVLAPAYRALAPESFDPLIADTAYIGDFRLSDPLPGGDGMTIGRALLSPARTYHPIIRRVLADGRAHVSALFHNTGGGLTKCLKFGEGVRYVKDDLLPMPPLFRLLGAGKSLSAQEMVSVFNLGQRFEVVCAPAFAERVIAIADAFRVEAKVIGRVETATAGVELEISFNGELVKRIR